ncbi:MAG: hypothetical protein R2932_37435 [Caldilineaceae bacterium]
MADEQVYHLQSQIDLWLAGVAGQQGDRSAAERYLQAAEARLATTDYHYLQQEAVRLRATSNQRTISRIDR